MDVLEGGFTPNTVELLSQIWFYLTITEYTSLFAEVLPFP
jgi:hypothetical protein